MSRLFWIGVGAAAAVVAARKSRALVEAHTPPGVAQAAGVVSGLGGALRSARAEFSASLAEREGELRHGLLGDADLDAARARTDAWRADRADRSDRTDRAGRTTRSDRAGRHADPAATRPASTEPRAEDPSDGELGYSFF
ncbi:hypothetical protein [Pengzhenrongella sicca]|uniref:Secreted protein n=1 Tax=Pengzhenrongella sicca TaxID=2819238 RepID=A0A8A4ZAG6_9MICO|nr:hypothetical protein [Pengzhenrongella sicca]QTE28019.1 hypothetical protein J4E96_11465 [Pengzhenrongella sicca]